MGKLKLGLKARIIAGLLSAGLYTLLRKLDISARMASLVHLMEAVPFPGTGMYTFLAARQLRPLYAAIAEEILEDDRITKLLDLGTGIGYLPIEIARRKPDVAVSGIDETADLIQIAQADARAARVSNSVDFVMGDPTSLPYPGRYFDMVVSVNVLHHWKDPVKVLEEVYHILAPGGQFWLYDYRSDVQPETWKRLLDNLPFLLRMAVLIGPVASSKFAYSMEDLLKMAGQTHFKIGAFERLSFPFFGRPMPVFNLLRLQKPETVPEEQAA
jgi:ubiquinone/menaquinone biosynthesis C-methylase UbiE